MTLGAIIFEERGRKRKERGKVRVKEKVKWVNH